MGRVRVFTSSAAEDAWVRDLFVEQGQPPETPWEISDLSVHESFIERWTEMRTRINGYDLAAQIIGFRIHSTEGALWEVECAKQEGVLAFRVWGDKDKRDRVPSFLAANNVVEGTWDGGPLIATSRSR